MNTTIYNVTSKSEAHSLNSGRYQGMIGRFEYKWHYRDIDNVNKVKALLREGQYSWPGGYAVIAYTSDGGCLCNDCIRDNLTSVIWSIKNEVNDGWRVSGLDVFYSEEDNGDICCDHCGKKWGDI